MAPSFSASLQIIPGLGCQILDAVDQFEDMGGLFCNTFACGGDAELTAAATLEQDDPQLILQLLDRDRKRRLRHEAGFRRAPEMSFTRDGKHILQFGQCHG